MPLTYMQRGHQQDAEEALGFLLEELHDECVRILQQSSRNPPSSQEVTSPTGERRGPTAELGWLEVGPKQKAAITRSSGISDTSSPITKIFGGHLRSELRVPGLKNSVTLEPYQPLQLDIGAPTVQNISDALKGLTRSETLHGNFGSPRGPSVSVTKQVFIETLPPVLILHLKRFEYNAAGGAQKIWKRVGYPLELEIPKEVFPPSKRGGVAIGIGKGLPKYRLISVVYHHGKNASGGHYTVDVRRQEGREWIRLDDTVIRRVRAEDVAEGGSGEDPKKLAKALAEHQHDSAKGKANLFDGLEEGGGDEESGGWSPVAAKGEKKFSGATDSTVNGSTTPSTVGQKTPKSNGFDRAGLKDNKVAYILLYQRTS